MNLALRYCCSLLLLAGCNFSRQASDIAPQLASATAFPATVIPVQDTPVPAGGVEFRVATATPFPTRPPLVPTPTRGPWQHVIRSNETLGYIIQLYGYRSFDVIEEIVRINDNVPDANLLPGEGSVILIPRPSPTPPPPDYTPLSLPPSLAEAFSPTSPATGMSNATVIMEHEVAAGQTVVDIMVQHDTTLEIISILNPDITFAGCDFGKPSGGPNCNPLLAVGQKVRVPAPTPTPTLSPTFSGAETTTPTPTWMPPRPVFPPQDAELPGEPLQLQWLSVGILQPGEVYLVQLSDAGTVLYNAITRGTSLTLPLSLIPDDGRVREISWTLGVARRNEEGMYEIVSGYPVPRRFRWRSPA